MTEDLDTSLGKRSLWAGKAIPMAQLEDETAYLWRLAADNMRIGQNSSVRTSVLNLVVCAPTIQSAQRASASLRDLASTHLARVIILILNRKGQTQSPAPIATWITLRSFPVISDMTRHSFEQVTLQVTNPALPHVASIVQPLLKPDLPVYLWWIGDTPEDDLPFTRLVRLSQRVIVDSASFMDPNHNINALASILKATPESAISDLNWSRLTPWRQLVAQFFDTAEYRPYLDGIKSIEIEHTVNSAGAIPARALFLAGWLKERLAWQKTMDEAAPSGTYRWRLADNQAQATQIEIRPHPEADAQPGAIYLLRLTSQVEQQQVVFTISLADPDHALTAVELGNENRQQRTVSLAAMRKENELLSDELEILGHDHQFEETLLGVASLLS